MSFSKRWTPYTQFRTGLSEEAWDALTPAEKKQRYANPIAMRPVNAVLKPQAVAKPGPPKAELAAYWSASSVPITVVSHEEWAQILKRFPR